jgi:LCP family protein required for cell wall assembly
MKLFKVALIALFLIVGCAVGVTMALFPEPHLHPGLFQLKGQNTATPGTSQGTEVTVTPQKGRVNLLLLGYDKSDSRTDTIMMICLDRDSRCVSLVSIPRDTEVFFGGRRHKINACIPYGGDSLLFSQLEKLTGVKPDYYIKADFEGFRRIIDLLGGVEFDVPRNMYYKGPAQKLTINLKKGPQTLDGSKAEQLVRFRGYSTGDLGRTKVQMDFMKALLEQKVTPFYLPRLPKLYSELTKYTKTNITLTDALQNLSAFKLLTGGNITTYQLPGQPVMISKISYFKADKEKTKEVFALHFKKPA